MKGLATCKGKGDAHGLGWDGITTGPELCPARCLACGKYFFLLCFLKELRKVSPERVAGVSVGKAAGRQYLCSPEVQLVKRGEGLAELWDERCSPVGVSGLREVRVWSDEGGRPAPWIALGLHTASLCRSLVGGWAGQGPGPSPASPGGSASSTAPGLGHLPASTVLRPSPLSLS